MAVFISVSTSAFGANGASNLNQRQGSAHVRRPLRGIQVKPDTYATIRVVSASGQDLFMLDGGSSNISGGLGTSSRYSNFILQAVSESRMEKQQIVETFGEDYVFFFGEKPRVMNFNGLLINTKDFNWKAEWWRNYDQTFRGTRLVEENARLYFYYDDLVVEGYVIGSASEDNAQNPYTVPFQFQLFVTSYTDLSVVGSVFFQEYAAAANGTAPGAPTLPGVPPSAPPTSSGAIAGLAQKSAQKAATGGLNGFLASAASLMNSADFKIQSVLEEARNTFYGRSLVYPADLSNTVQLPPIDNLAKFQPAPVNQPIHTMTDEYVSAPAMNVALDQAEIARVAKELALRSPAALDAKARADLAKMGIDASRRSTGYLLLGRAAFAGAQVFGSFGIRQADGVLREGLGDLVGG